ncbi:hypothetical protein ACJX0J_007549, partial [Zea mays]
RSGQLHAKYYMLVSFVVRCFMLRSLFTFGLVKTFFVIEEKLFQISLIKIIKLLPSTNKKRQCLLFEIKLVKILLDDSTINDHNLFSIYFDIKLRTVPGFKSFDVTQG